MSYPAAFAEMPVEMLGLRAARAAVSAIFFTNGVLFATWVAHIPSMKTQHEISEALQSSSTRHTGAPVETCRDDPGIWPKRLRVK